MAAAESKIFFIREINRLLIKFSDTQLWYSKQTIETNNPEKVSVSIIYFSSLFYKHKISKYFLIHQIITKLFYKLCHISQNKLLNRDYRAGFMARHG
jgi:hypothetical protein